MTLNELTVFTGSTASQTLTLPANAVHGITNQIVNYASVSVTISGGASSLSNYGVSGSITLLSMQSLQVAADGSGGWSVISAQPGGGVTSWDGRTGVVVPANGDYFGVVAAALTGATSGTARLAGAVSTNGAPTSGTFAVGDLVLDPSATLWCCTIAGTPGTWNPTVSAYYASRSATATLTLNELTVFTGSTASQTLTLPANAVHGITNQIVNYASVSVTISGGASSLSNYGVSGSITLLPMQSLQVAANGSGGWSVISDQPVVTVTTITSSATPTVNTDTSNSVNITALATAVTSFTTGLSGSPQSMQKLTYRIKDNGSPQTLAWGASFEACGVALPTTTTASKRTTVGFIYDSGTSKWGCVASVTEA